MLKIVRDSNLFAQVHQIPTTAYGDLWLNLGRPAERMKLIDSATKKMAVRTDLARFCRSSLASEISSKVRR
jgi:hypothetical protein